jgi:hypothetical protein
VAAVPAPRTRAPYRRTRVAPLPGLLFLALGTGWQQIPAARTAGPGSLTTTAGPLRVETTMPAAAATTGCAYAAELVT